MSLKFHAIAVASALLLVACVEDEAGEAAQLLVPDQVSVQWDESFNGTDDGLGALVPVDLMVYEGDSGEPMRGVRLDLDTTEGLEIIDAGDIDVLASDCLDCVWDSGRDRYVDWANTSDVVQTDDDGLARVYLWIDAFDAAVPLAAQIEMQDDTGSTEALIEVARD